MIVAIQLCFEGKELMLPMLADEIRQCKAEAYSALFEAAKQLVPSGFKVSKITYVDEDGDDCTLTPWNADDALLFRQEVDETTCFLRLKVEASAAANAAVEQQPPESQQVAFSNASSQAAKEELPDAQAQVYMMALSSLLAQPHSSEVRAAALEALQMAAARARCAEPGVHLGVECDVTGMCPIVGTRYHKRGENYDLCEAEYQKLGAAEQELYEVLKQPLARPDLQEVLKARHGWSQMGVVKEAPFFELMESLRAHVTPEEFDNVAAAVEPVFHVPQDCLLPCLEELRRRFTALLGESADNAGVEIIAALPDCVVEVVGTAERLRADAAREAAALVEAVVGVYENRDYGAQDRNDWHYVELREREQHDHDEVGLTWKNRAGISWTLTAVPGQSATNALAVGQDCPYFNGGHVTCKVEYNGQGRVSGLRGPSDELYVRVDFAETQAPIVEEPIPAVGAQVLGARLELTASESVFELPEGQRGDVSHEPQFAALLGQLPQLTQAFCIGRVSCSKESQLLAHCYVRNTGSQPWPADTTLRIVAGPAHGFPQMELGAVTPGEVADLGMDLSLTPQMGASVWALCHGAHGEPFGPLLSLETVAH